MLSNEAMDRQLVDAEETSPGICRSIYKRKAITATHYAEVKVTVAGDVADYTASVLDTMAEHLAYKMNVAVGNVKITAAAGSVVLTPPTSRWTTTSSAAWSISVSSPCPRQPSSAWPSAR